MRETGIRFIFRGEVREIREIDPTLTVLRWLREQEGATGTKEGCAEGDCGACTVAIGDLDDSGATVRYRAVNACIQFLPALHGRHLVTVEDLKSADGTLHPVQQAMVDAHGSQCGFCTPGFVMSLFALRHGEPRPDVARVNDALAGNLCRCTGYGPIITAAQTMYDLEGQAPFEADVPSIRALLRQLRDDSVVCVGRDGRYWWAPARLNDLATLLEQHPNATVVAGGTDVGLWVTKQHRTLNPIISLGRVAELRRLNVAAGTIEIGAGVAYTDAWETLARFWPDFGELTRRLGSTQIRNAGTLGGNIANGSPIGDTPPALIALGATLVLRRGATRRTMALESFFLDYGRQDRAPGEFVEKILLPTPRPDWIFRCYKLSKRFDQDISAVCGAFALRITDGRIAEARLCYGGMAGTPRRASRAEDVLIGQPWNAAAVGAAIAALDLDYTPLMDMRASADYRRLAAGNLLRKFWLETTDDGKPIRLIGRGRAA